MGKEEVSGETARRGRCSDRERQRVSGGRQQQVGCRRPEDYVGGRGGQGHLCACVTNRATVYANFQWFFFSFFKNRVVKITGKRTRVRRSSANRRCSLVAPDRIVATEESHADQVQVRVRRDRVRPVHVADHVRTAGGQLLQSKYTEIRLRVSAPPAKGWRARASFVCFIKKKNVRRIAKNAFKTVVAL